MLLIKKWDVRKVHQELKVPLCWEFLAKEESTQIQRKDET